MVVASVSKDFPVADPGFSPGVAPTPKLGLFCKFFTENCMKMKEFGSPGGGVPRAPLDPPMLPSTEETILSSFDYFNALTKIPVQHIRLQVLAYC